MSESSLHTSAIMEVEKQLMVRLVRFDQHVTNQFRTQNANFNKKLVVRLKRLKKMPASNSDVRNERLRRSGRLMSRRNDNSSSRSGVGTRANRTTNATFVSSFSSTSSQNTNPSNSHSSSSSFASRRISSVASSSSVNSQQTCQRSVGPRNDDPVVVSTTIDDLWSSTPPRFVDQIERIFETVVIPTDTVPMLHHPSRQSLLTPADDANRHIVQRVVQRSPIRPRPVNVQNQRRRRHAILPHKVTYLTALTRSNEQLEVLATSPFNLGPLNEICEHCGALFFVKERKNRQGTRLMCCKNGDIDLPHYKPCPDALRSLYTSGGTLSTEFRTNIRRLNSLFALASFKTSGGLTAQQPHYSQGQGHWCFWICGQIYHFLNGIPINRNQLERPSLATYYFLDVDEARSIRRQFLNEELSELLLDIIERVLRENHEYIIGYKTMFQLIREHQSLQHGVVNVVASLPPPIPNGGVAVDSTQQTLSVSVASGSLRRSSRLLAAATSISSSEHSPDLQRHNSRSVQSPSQQQQTPIGGRHRANTNIRNQTVPLLPNNAGVENLIIGFTKDPIMRRQLQTHNLPEHGSDIAAVFTGDDPPFEVDLKVYPSRPDHPDPKFRHQELKLLSPFTDCFVYPLLFPCGDIGYRIDYKHRFDRNKSVSLNEYYKYRLQIRDRFSTFHYAGKLFQQFVVDAWVKIESKRLWFLRQNQKKFQYRVAFERSLRQNIVQPDDIMANNVLRPPVQPQQHGIDIDVSFLGKRYILPASFSGGPRNKYKLYLECMATISRHGKPDLLITFTCNPKWKDITENLKAHQKFEHRPDLICRVFYNRLLEFIDDIVNKQVYGIVLSYFYVIEFQKRGLPHAHVLITFHEENKIVTSESVDRIIHAYIPDRETQPLLYALVAKHQVHMPCGRLNPRAKCVDDTTKKCRKYFPKKYVPNTLMHQGDNKRPLYKRPADGRTIFIPNADGSVGGVNIHNTRVIPYNPYALAKFQNHINFEAVGSIETIKYLHKYLNKGPDFINLYMLNHPRQQRSTDNNNISDAAAANEGFNRPAQNNNTPNAASDNQPVIIDEIRNYVTCRYVSSMEAMWRILDYPLFDRSHSVITLPTHLPHERYVIFQEDENVEAIDHRIERMTKLEAWFKLNQTDDEAKRLRYVEIPEHYVWDNRTTTWNKRRQVSKQIGCLLEFTAADNLEKYYFSVLLKYVTGATSYESLRTLDDGTVCATFREACIRKHLLLHNDEFDRALADASTHRLPGMLRKLFALICCVAIDDNVAQIPYLWNKYKSYLIDDLLHRGISRRRAIDIVIRFIANIVTRNRGDLDIADLGISNDLPPQQMTTRHDNIANNDNQNDGFGNNNIRNDNNDGNVNDQQHLRNDNNNDHRSQVVDNDIEYSDLVQDVRDVIITDYSVAKLNRDQKLVYYRIVKTCATNNHFLIDSRDFKDLLLPDVYNQLFTTSSDDITDDNFDRHNGINNISTLTQSVVDDSPLRIESSQRDTECISLEEIFEIDKQVNENYRNGANPIGYIYYLDGPGGTGKTYLYNTIAYNLIQRYRKTTIAVAWTGIAANLLIHGQTVHRAFKLPLDITDTTVAGWPLEHYKSAEINKSQIVIWDEAPMSNKSAVEAIDRYLRDLTKLNIPMGGKIVLFGGDFRQILPVVVGGGANATITSCLKVWTYWPMIRQLRLDQNMRAKSQQIVEDLGKIKFSEWLLRLGNGQLPNIQMTTVPDAPSDLIEIPLLFRATSINELLQFVYQNNFSDPSNGSKAILCPTNSNVYLINNKILDMMSNTIPMRTYFSVDEYAHEEDDLQVPQDLLHSIDVASLPPHELKLKVGCIVILVKNLDIEAGQCNGSRYIVTNLGTHFVEVEALQGQQIGQKLYLPKITMQAKCPVLPRKFKRTQFPIKLAYAMTINKSQGQTLNRVGIYLQRPCFTHGQLYVAFSRVTTHENVRIFVEDRNDQGTYKFRYRKFFTRNVIFRPILNDSDTNDLLQNLRNVQIIYDELDERDESIVSLDRGDGNGNDKNVGHINIIDYLPRREIVHEQSPIHNDDIENQFPSPTAQRAIVGDGNVLLPSTAFMAPAAIERYLRTRISTANQPGTSGLHFERAVPPPRGQDYSSSDED